MREKSFKRQFGGAVRDARLGAGLSQRELAERAGIAEKYLSRVEGGHALPSVFVAWRLAGALGVGLDALVKAAPMERSAEVGAVMRVLAGRSDDELERARRILVELFR